MNVRVRITVSGLVQGVGFRSFIQRTALDLGLSGWVRNREDGKVEAVLEGSADAIARAVDACKQGPARSTVGKVEFSGEPAEGLSGFSVKDD